MREMQRAEALWMKIVGVLLILLGLVLFASPRITYRTKEKIIHTDSIDVTANRQKTVIIPSVVGAIAVGAGVLMLVLSSKRPQT
jgi:uncharacterized membrane protein HdeD (DUF308 family)